jgi:hypothetical protein
MSPPSDARSDKENSPRGCNLWGLSSTKVPVVPGLGKPAKDFGHDLREVADHRYP